MALGLHLTVVLAVAAWVGLAAWQRGVGELLLTLAVLLLLSLSMVARYPLWALVVYGVTAYSLPRYGTDLALLLEADLLNGVALAGLTGLVAWRLEQWRPVAIAVPVVSWALWAMGSLVAWGALSFALSMAERPDLHIVARHHPASLLHAAILLILAFVAMQQARSALELMFVLCALPLLRALLQWNSSLYLDGDLPAVAAMVMPVALLAAGMPKLQLGWRVAAAAASLALLAILMAAQNRGAAIGLLFGLVAIWLNARKKGVWLLVGVLGAVLMLSLTPRTYIDRFSVLWNPQASHATAGLDRATVQERQELWLAATKAIRDRPMLGAGPGREIEALRPYRQGGSRLVAHNSAISIALETGLVGLAMYLAIFLGTMAQLQWLIRDEADSIRRAQARMVQAALCAYLGIGLVISRHDMALAYVLVGWALALHATRQGSVPGSSPDLAAPVPQGLWGHSADRLPGPLPADPPLPRAAQQVDRIAASAVAAWLRVVLVGYALFIVYGSLVPLNFKPMDAAAAWQAFWQMPMPDLKSGDRSDWAVNFLLLMPLSFGWRFLQGKTAGIRPMFIAIALPLMSVSIEFLQLHFPPRTPSFNDVAAQVAGMLAGLALHAAWGDKFGHWLARFQPQASTESRLPTLLMAYLVLMLAFSLMPLDLSVSPVELYRKWRDGRVILVPFSAPMVEPWMWMYGLLTDVLVWVPVAVLWSLDSPRRPLGMVLLRVGLAATAVELAQLLVLSRVTDVTDVVLALCGGLLGWSMVQKWQRAGLTGVVTWDSLYRRAWWVWLLLLPALYWMPFDFEPAALVDGRLSIALDRALFQTYFERSEFGALNEIVRKLLFFLPGGLLLALGWPAGRSWRWALLPALATLLELGQVMLPGRVGDATDALLQSVGGWVGLKLGQWICAQADASEQRSTAPLSVSNTGEVDDSSA